MRNYLLAAVLLAGILPRLPEACVDPLSPWEVGVIFTNGEQCVPELIEDAASDENCYIKTCIQVEAYKGQAILKGEAGSGVQDQLTINGVSVSINTLRIAVTYGGGCKEHVFKLYHDGSILISQPGQVNLYLSHDANGDDCKALVHDTLLFDLTSLSDVAPLGIRVYAPAAQEPYSERPLWTPASGLKTQQCSYKFRSVSSPAIMTHVGIFDGPFESGMTDYRVLLIFDTTAAEPSNEVKATALAAELDRLVAIGVLSLTEEEITRIRDALAVVPGQYWTRQDSVLYFNSWFDGTSVNGVRGVYSDTEVTTVKGCGAGVTYELPPKELTASGVRPGEHRMAASSAGIRIVITQNGIDIRFASRTETALQFVLTDMAGRRIAELPVVSGSERIMLPLQAIKGRRLSPGCYFAVVRSGGSTLQTRRITVP